MLQNIKCYVQKIVNGDFTHSYKLVCLIGGICMRVSYSTWAVSIVAVPKKDGHFRGTHVEITKSRSTLHWM